MNPAYIVAGLTILVNGIIALIAWGLRGQIAVLEGRIKGQGELLSQKIETVRQEMSTKLAEAGAEFYRSVNGAYVRKELHTELSARVDRVETRVDEIQ